MNFSVRRIVIKGFEAIRVGWMIVGVTLLTLLLVEVGLRVKRLVAERAPATRSLVTGDPRAQDWYTEYRREFDAARVLQWRPYVYFRRVPSSRGRYINIDSLGHRWTPQPAQPATPVARVRLYGGSTMWGEPQRENRTIAAEISRRLQQLAGPGARVEVTNVAETGYVFTQELIQLMLDLRAGSRPDVVLFYDGLNDVAATVQRGAPGDPQNESNRVADFALGRALDRASYESRLQKDVRPFAVLGGQAFKRLALVQWAQSRKAAPARTFIAADSAAIGTARTYVENARHVEMLAARYGFTPVYVWQPNLHATEKRLDPYEQGLRQQIASDPFHHRVQAAHRLVPQMLDSAMRGVAPERFVNAASLFKDDPQPVFVDRIGHTTESSIPTIVDSFWPTLEAAVSRQRAKSMSAPSNAARAAK